ncbi:MAG: FecR domain-containing protein, partial [Magnetococcales bacterium]|nr:FecR domain-containing protein [Magnetococcales bacterium]
MTVSHISSQLRRSTPGFCLLFIMLGLLLAPAPSQAAKQGIGRIKSAIGTAYIQRGEQRLPVEIGSVIQPQDQLLTGQAGALGVIFNDYTVVSLGPRSAYEIEAFIYRPSEDQYTYQAILRKGSMRFRTGRIAKYQPSAVRLRTPTARINVRGTLFIVEVDEEASKDPSERQTEVAAATRTEGEAGDRPTGTAVHASEDPAARGIPEKGGKAGKACAGETALEDLDADAAFQKKIIFPDSDTSRLGIGTLTLTSEETGSINPATYYFDIQKVITDTPPVVATLMSG